MVLGLQPLLGPMLSRMLETSFDIFAGHFGKVSSSLELPWVCVT